MKVYFLLAPKIPMNIRNNLLASLALLLSIVATQVQAQTYSVGFDQPLYTVIEGGTVDVLLVLTEEITTGQTARLAPGGDDGLFSFGIGIDYSSFTGAASGSTYNSVVLDPLFTFGASNSGEDITLGPGAVVSFEGTEDFFGNDTDGEIGVGGRMVSATVWEIDLATVTFDAGAAGSLTDIQLQDHVAEIAAFFQFGDGVEPPIGFTRSQILVVPEPSTFSLACLFIGAAMTRRKRLR